MKKMKHVCRTITVLAVAAACQSASAGGPLVFEWSGTDSNNAPFSVSFTVTDVLNGETGYNDNFFDAAGVAVTTETVGQKQIITDVDSLRFGGTYTYPTANAFDPYYFILTEDNAGQTAIQMLGGADNSDIGLTYDGNPINWVWAAGTANFSYVDPSSATSLSDLFPVGTYSLTAHPSGINEVVHTGGFFDPAFTSLTISVAPAVNPIPEPASAGLGMLGLGGLALLRRRRHA